MGMTLTTEFGCELQVVTTTLLKMPQSNDLGAERHPSGAMLAPSMAAPAELLHIARL